MRFEIDDTAQLSAHVLCDIHNKNSNVIVTSTHSVLKQICILFIVAIDIPIYV